MTTQETKTAVTDKLVKESAQNLLSTIKSSEGGPALERELNVMGADAIKRARNLQTVMSSAVADALPQLESDSELATIIDETVLVTDQINPNSVTKKWLYKIPVKPLRMFLVKRYIADFESTSGKINGMFDALEAGKEQMLQKMLELEAQWRSLKETDNSLQIEIQVAEEVQQALIDMDTSSLSEYDKEKYEAAAAKVARKLRDFQTIRVAISQFYVSIKQTADVQTQLDEAIDSLRLVGPIIFQNAVMINAAITQQKKISGAVNSVSESLGNALAANARVTKQNAEEVASLYNNPVLAMDKMELAFQDLNDAVNITRQARLDATSSARDMADSLKVMNKKFEPITQGVGDALEQATGGRGNVVSEQ
jgi:uncharacterized protein YaaN involved in tellurite resistance